jgi:hypothetical protein
MIEQRKPTEGELRALRRMELALRDFMPRYDAQPRWVWSPPTSRMAEEVRRLLAELDESRRDRGAPPVVSSGGAEVDEDEAAGADEDVAGDEGDEELADEGCEDVLVDEAEDDDDDLEEGDE